MKNKGKAEKQKKETPLVSSFGVVNDIKGLSDKHRAILDVYYENGYNKSRAVMEVVEGIKYQSQANAMFNAIMKKPECKKYLESKRVRLKAKCDISNEQVLRELMSWAYADATDFISLSEEQIKELPSNVRRCIQSFKTTERTEVDRKGNAVTTKTIDLKLINKAEAMKEISKHIGFYEADNDQKRPVIDLSKATPEELNVLLKLTQSNTKEQPKTIDITPD